MKIKKITVYNFRQIEKKEYSFKDGINVVSGPNESGKTTLFHIILSVLFDNPKKIRKSLLDTYRPWNKDIYPVIDAVLEKDNVEYNIHKDFNTKKITLNGENLENFDKFSLDFMGLDINVFKKLSCVYQNQISAIEEDSKALEKSVLDIVSSTTTTGLNVLDAISKVSKKLQNMKLGVDRISKNIGIIKSLEIDITNLEEKLKILKEDFSSHSTQVSELEKMKKEKEDLDKKFNENKIFIDNVKKSKELDTSLKEITSKMKDIDLKINRLNKLYSDLDRVKKEFSLKEFENMNLMQNEILNLRNSIELREKDLKDVSSKKEEIDKMGLKPIRKNSAIVYIVSIILFAGTIVTAFFGYYLVVSIFIDIIFIGLYLRFVDYNRLENFENPAIDSVTQIDNEIKGYKTTLSGILNSFGVSSIDDFFRKKTSFLSSKEELLKIESTIKGILGKDTLDTLEGQISELSVQKRDLNTELTDELKDSISIDPILLNRKRIENEELDLDLFSLNEEIISLESRISDTSVSNEDIEQLEINIKSKKEEKEFYIRRMKILEIVEKNLKIAKDSTIENISVDLNKLGSEWISKITEGKYTKLDIVNNEKISVLDPSINKFLSAEDFLSTGLMDQIYLLSRLSILHIVLNNKSTIMMFDDPFINFDKERLDKTIDLLKYFSKTNQIFLFTCHNFFSDLI